MPKGQNGQLTALLEPDLSYFSLHILIGGEEVDARCVDVPVAKLLLEGIQTVTILEPDDAGPVVGELFDLYASGRASLNDLVRWMAAKGYRYSKPGMRSILKNSVYIGRIVSGKRSRFHTTSEVQDVRGKHKPILDEEAFHVVQRLLRANYRRGR